MDSSKAFSFGLIAVLLLACPSTAPQEETGGSVPSGENVTSVAPEPSISSQPPPPPESGNPQLEAQWARITQPNVEQACLAQAKREAEASGYSGSLVFSCSCTANEGDEAKAYPCSIAAADGTHTALVVCSKAKQECGINSEKGKQTYTFDEIEALWG